MVYFVVSNLGIQVGFEPTILSEPTSRAGVYTNFTTELVHRSAIENHVLDTSHGLAHQESNLDSSD